MLIVVVWFYSVVTLVIIDFVFILMSTVRHLLVYVCPWLYLLYYFIYLFALGSDVTVSRVHLKVLCNWMGFSWFLQQCLWLLSLYLYCFRALVEWRKIDFTIFDSLQYLIFCLFDLWLSSALDFNLMWSGNLHFILVWFLFIRLQYHLITIVRFINFPDSSIFASIICLSADIRFHFAIFFLLCFFIGMKAIFWFFLYFINLFY